MVNLTILLYNLHEKTINMKNRKYLEDCLIYSDLTKLEIILKGILQVIRIYIYIYNLRVVED